MKIKFELLLVIVFDIIYYVAMGLYWNKRKNEVVAYTLLNSTFLVFSIIITAFSVLSFIIIAFKSYYRDNALTYIGLKTFYMSITIVYFSYILFEFLSTFEDYRIFTRNYILWLSFFVVITIVFILITIRQILQLRNNAFSINFVNKDLLNKKNLENQDQSKEINL